ncbi:3-phenylpropionate/cinnamic acid dioxygenase ferredoxin--NAD(+) reductase component [Streptomyces hirsutus]
MSDGIVVVGASLAGLRVAEALRAGGYTGRLRLVGDEHHLPYDRPPLSKQVLTGEWEIARTALTTPAKALRGRHRDRARSTGRRGGHQPLDVRSRAHAPHMIPRSACSTERQKC